MILLIIAYNNYAARAMVVTGKRCSSPQGATAKTTRRVTAFNDKALDAFMTTKLQIDAILERLAALSADHFETHPDEINLGHVGSLNHYASLLREMADSAFKEGEHAE